MRTWLIPALVAIAMVAPSSSSAQADLAVHITPHAGIITPPDWFYYQVTDLGEGPMEWTEAAILRANVVGLMAELELPAAGVWVRGSVQRTTGAKTFLAFAILNEAFPNPATVVRTRYWVPSTITFASVDLAFPTRFELPYGVQPYFAAGLGGKRYVFDREVLADGDPAIVAPEDGTVAMANLGAGVVVRWERFGLDLQVRDAISEYWDDVQHDILWLVGLSWRAF